MEVKFNDNVDDNPQYQLLKLFVFSFNNNSDCLDHPALEKISKSGVQVSAKLSKQSFIDEGNTTWQESDIVYTKISKFRDTKDFTEHEINCNYVIQALIKLLPNYGGHRPIHIQSNSSALKKSLKSFSTELNVLQTDEEIRAEYERTDIDDFIEYLDDEMFISTNNKFSKALYPHLKDFLPIIMNCKVRIKLEVSTYAYRKYHKMQNPTPNQLKAIRVDNDYLLKEIAKHHHDAMLSQKISNSVGDKSYKLLGYDDEQRSEAITAKANGHKKITAVKSAALTKKLNQYLNKKDHAKIYAILKENHINNFDVDDNEKAGLLDYLANPPYEFIVKDYENSVSH